MAELKVVPVNGGKKFNPTPHEDVYFKVTGDETDGAFDYFDIRVGYLEGPPLHIHSVQHETFHVLEGELRLQVGDRMIDAKADEFVSIPMGTVHTYVNLKKQPARAVGVLSPGGFDKFVEELNNYTSSVKGPPDQAKVAEISGRHNQVTAGPPLAVVLGLKGGAAKQEQPKPEGSWLVVHRELDGRAASKEELKKNETHLILKGSTTALRINGKVIAEGTFQFLHGQKPGAFDITWTRFDTQPQHQGKTTKAIYELQGDSLKICMTNVSSDRERPTEFVAPPNSNLAFVIYDRLPEAAQAGQGG